MSKRRRPGRDAVIRDAGPYTVVSLVGGDLTIKAGYHGVAMAEGCTRDRDEQGCRACGAHHIFGFLGRMELAERIETVLNSYRASGGGA
jgi:hypothetical protein